MEWYYAKHGKQEGPVALEALQGLLQSGQLAPTDLVWKEGMAEWTAAKDVPEVSPPAAAAPPVATGAVPPAGAVPTAGAVPPSGPVASPVAGLTPPAQQVPNYLVPAILVTVLCCVPFGIPAIVFAAKVDGMVARGDIPGAIEASNKAKMWSWIAFGSGFAGILLYVIVVIGAASGGM